MNVGQTFLTVGVTIGIACVSSVAVIAIAKSRRGRVVARSRAMLAPYRRSLIAMASGEDHGREARAALYAVPAPIWVRLRPSVVAILPKIRGVPAVDLRELMRSHGEIDRATRMLVSRSAVRRANAAYLLGIVRDPVSVALLLPLLSDASPDVRMVAARALGHIGNPSAASDVLRALRTAHGQSGLPAWVAAEALLAMGIEIGLALQVGLASKDPAVRNVCVTVAGHGAYLCAAPQLRILLATDSDSGVRANAAVALGRVGGGADAATLARHADASEETEMRRTCAAALGNLGHRESLEILAGLLGDCDRRLAEVAADSMVRIGDEGIARLEQAAATPGQGPGARAAGSALELAGLRGQLTVRVTRSG